MNMNLHLPLNVHGVNFTFEEINRVVSSFYSQVQRDPLLHIPFQSVDNWPHHIERLTHFWWIRFGGKPYLDVSYDPVGKHFETGFNDHFLERWLELFRLTLESELNADQSKLWGNFAKNIGAALSRNNDLMILRSRTKV